MKKTLLFEDLDCANCAAKIEEAVKKLDGIQSVTVSFMSQKMTVEMEDSAAAEIEEKIRRTVAEIEPDATLL